MSARAETRLTALEQRLDRLEKLVTFIEAAHDYRMDGLRRGVDMLFANTNRRQEGDMPFAADALAHESLEPDLRWMNAKGAADRPSLPDGYRMSVDENVSKVIVHEDGKMQGQCLWLDDEEDAEQHRIRAAMHMKAAALLDALEADARKEEDDG